MHKGGAVYDPLNGKAGEVGDVYISDGKIVPSSPGADVEVINADGLIVMPGGVDIHSHRRSKVNVGRVLCPEDHRTDRYRAPQLPEAA